jgi:lipopolysaccharide transport system ATP-binding protein
MNDEVLIRVENVSKKFCRDLKSSLWYGVQDIVGELLGRNGGQDHELRPKEFWALRDISLELKRGESLGLIGSNGAGKSTLLKLLNGLLKPDQGRITVRGRMGALIELGAGFNPILTGRENIYVNAAVLGIPKRQVDRIIGKIIDFAELEEFIDTPVQSYSSGMRVRLGFAVAAQLDPDILVVDEVLAVGDAYFQRKCISYMKNLFHSHKTAVILVSHNLFTIEQVCDRVIRLDYGQIVARGQTRQVVSQYLYNVNMQYAERTAEHAAQREGSGEIRFT